jgi:hypothetical protein
VEAVHRHEDKRIVLLASENDIVETTPEHPFLVADGEWRAAGDLRIGDRVRRLDGTYGEVRATRTVDRVFQMFNLTVSEAHTFFVGTQGWLVHNTCMPWGSPDPAELERNMLAASMKKPTYRTETHHIVAGSDPRAELARQKLMDFGIKANDPANGVFLAYRTHKEVHTDDYYDILLERILPARNESQLREALRSLANDLETGVVDY